jgi:hypothetical protein
MAEPKIEKKPDRVDATLVAVATKRTSKTGDTNGVRPPADVLTPGALTKRRRKSKLVSHNTVKSIAPLRTH